MNFDVAALLANVSSDDEPDERLKQRQKEAAKKREEEERKRQEDAKAKLQLKKPSFTATAASKAGLKYSLAAASKKEDERRMKEALQEESKRMTAGSSSSSSSLNETDLFIKGMATMNRLYPGLLRTSTAGGKLRFDGGAAELASHATLVNYCLQQHCALPREAGGGEAAAASMPAAVTLSKEQRNKVRDAFASAFAEALAPTVVIASSSSLSSSSFSSSSAKTGDGPAAPGGSDNTGAVDFSGLELRRDEWRRPLLPSTSTGTGRARQLQFTRMYCPLTEALISHNNDDDAAIDDDESEMLSSSYPATAKPFLAALKKRRRERRKRPTQGAAAAAYASPLAPDSNTLGTATTTMTGTPINIVPCLMRGGTTFYQRAAASVKAATAGDDEDQDQESNPFAGFGVRLGYRLGLLDRAKMRDAKKKAFVKAKKEKKGQEDASGTAAAAAARELLLATIVPSLLLPGSDQPSMEAGESAAEEDASFRVGAKRPRGQEAKTSSASDDDDDDDGDGDGNGTASSAIIAAVDSAIALIERTCADALLSDPVGTLALTASIGCNFGGCGCGYGLHEEALEEGKESGDDDGDEEVELALSKLVNKRKRTNAAISARLWNDALRPAMAYPVSSSAYLSPEGEGEGKDEGKGDSPSSTGSALLLLSTSYRMQTLLANPAPLADPAATATASQVPAGAHDWMVIAAAEAAAVNRVQGNDDGKLLQSLLQEEAAVLPIASFITLVQTLRQDSEAMFDEGSSSLFAAVASSSSSSCCPHHAAAVSDVKALLASLRRRADFITVLATLCSLLSVSIAQHAVTVASVTVAGKGGTASRVYFYRNDDLKALLELLLCLLADPWVQGVVSAFPSSASTIDGHASSPTSISLDPFDSGLTSITGQAPADLPASVWESISARLLLEPCDSGKGKGKGEGKSNEVSRDEAGCLKDSLFSAFKAAGRTAAASAVVRLIATVSDVLVWRELVEETMTSRDAAPLVTPAAIVASIAGPGVKGPSLSSSSSSPSSSSSVFPALAYLKQSYQDSIGSAFARAVQRAKRGDKEEKTTSPFADVAKRVVGLLLLSSSSRKQGQQQEHPVFSHPLTAPHPAFLPASYPSGSSEFPSSLERFGCLGTVVRALHSATDGANKFPRLLAYPVALTGGVEAVARVLALSPSSSSSPAPCLLLPSFSAVFYHSVSNASSSPLGSLLQTLCDEAVTAMANCLRRRKSPSKSRASSSSSSAAPAAPAAKVLDVDVDVDVATAVKRLNLQNIKARNSLPHWDNELGAEERLALVLKAGGAENIRLSLASAALALERPSSPHDITEAREFRHLMQLAENKVLPSSSSSLRLTRPSETATGRVKVEEAVLLRHREIVLRAKSSRFHGHVARLHAAVSCALRILHVRFTSFCRSVPPAQPPFPEFLFQQLRDFAAAKGTTVGGSGQKKARDRNDSWFLSSCGEGSLIGAFSHPLLLRVPASHEREHQHQHQRQFAFSVATLASCHPHPVPSSFWSASGITPYRLRFLLTRHVAEPEQRQQLDEDEEKGEEERMAGADAGAGSKHSHQELYKERFLSCCEEIDSFLTLWEKDQSVAVKGPLVVKEERKQLKKKGNANKMDDDDGDGDGDGDDDDVLLAASRKLLPEDDEQYLSSSEEEEEEEGGDHDGKADGDSECDEGADEDEEFVDVE